MSQHSGWLIAFIFVEMHMLFVVDWNGMDVVIGQHMKNDETSSDSSTCNISFLSF